jgi:hypothetical protein
MGVVYEKYFNPTSYANNTADVVLWNKYGCNSSYTITRYYDPCTMQGVYVKSSNWFNVSVGTGYGFSESSGYYLTGSSNMNSRTNDATGYYSTDDENVYVLSISDTSVFNGSTVYNYNMTAVASCSTEGYYTYSKGSTSYGSIASSSGKLPEDGTLIEGSADGDYCIINVNGNYYYYEKQS